MSRDPSITVRERLIHAARRWAAAGDVDILDTKEEAELFRRVGELSAAVAAFEKFHGMRHIVFRVPHATPGKDGAASN